MGAALLNALEQLTGEGPLSVWAHGDLPGARALATSRGYGRERVLLQMRRDLAGVDPDPHPALPDGVRVLPFRPGRAHEKKVLLRNESLRGSVNFGELLSHKPSA